MDDRTETQGIVYQATFDDLCARVAKLSYDTTMSKLAADNADVLQQMGQQGGDGAADVADVLNAGSLPSIEEIDQLAMQYLRAGNKEAAEQVAKVAEEARALQAA